MSLFLYILKMNYLNSRGLNKLKVLTEIWIFNIKFHQMMFHFICQCLILVQYLFNLYYASIQVGFMLLFDILHIKIQISEGTFDWRPRLFKYFIFMIYYDLCNQFGAMSYKFIILIYKKRCTNILSVLFTIIYAHTSIFLFISVK